MNKKGQSVSYNGFNVHQQNDIVEKRTQDMQDKAPTNLLHTTTRWPTTISLSIWTMQYKI